MYLLLHQEIFPYNGILTDQLVACKKSNCMVATGTSNLFHALCRITKIKISPNIVIDITAQNYMVNTTLTNSTECIYVANFTGYTRESQI